MVQVGIRRFIDALQKSELASVEVLRDALNAYREREGKPLADPVAVCNHLIDLGLVTAWHCEKLLTGKYKGFFLGDYKLLGHLGTGGMSTVYLAEHRQSGLLRAIKVLPRKRVGEKSYLERFRHEAEATRRLDHPGIVRAFELGQDHETYYYVMEYCIGQDVSEMVKEFGPLDFFVAARIAAQTARALEYAHRKGLIHRDIKPGNLLVDAQAQVKLLDLGLAISSALDAESQRVFRERVIGTADYLSPEQAVDSQRVDPRTDLYSLGCTLYYMLTGHPPFPDGAVAERLQAHLTKEPRDIRLSRPDCPVELIAICKRMMVKKPKERYQNANQVFEALTRWMASNGRRVDEAIAIKVNPPSFSAHVSPQVSGYEIDDSEASGSDSHVIRVVDIDDLEKRSHDSGHLQLLEVDKQGAAIPNGPIDESQLTYIAPAPLPTPPIAPLVEADPLIGKSKSKGAAAVPLPSPSAPWSPTGAAFNRTSERLNFGDWRIWVLGIAGVLLLLAIVIITVVIVASLGQ